MYKILANSLFLGKDIIYLTECHSTNDLAMEKIRSKALREGSIVITDKQTKGKGQRGNRWWSEPGMNLTFSLVLQPTFLSPARQFELSMAVSLALRHALGTWCQGLKIKWPNDLVHESGKKLGGILIENILHQKSIEYAVVGIGLNVNQHMYELPSATSMADLTGKDFSIPQVLEVIVQYLERYYLLLKRGEVKKIRAEYLKEMYRFEAWANYRDELPFLGKIVGINEEGKLILEKEDGSVNFYGLKEVTYL